MLFKVLKLLTNAFLQFEEGQGHRKHIVVFFVNAKPCMFKAELVDIPSLQVVLAELLTVLRKDLRTGVGILEVGLTLSVLDFLHWLSILVVDVPGVFVDVNV